MNNTVWKDTAREAQLDLISDMFDDLRQDHLCLFGAVEDAIQMIKDGDDGVLDFLEYVVESRKCD